ncbi:MAG: tetratricopeptide repeat protein [Thermoanaerobaculia bacterium]|nr:tetratricopeptide repeat protein [Thermoanaerobaculia bacterium]
MEKALYGAGLAELKLGRPADARALFDRLRRDYPEGKFVRKVPKMPEEPRTATAGL